MERHVNATLTRDLSQTISCPWLLLRPCLSSPPTRPVSLPLSPLPLSLNNRSAISTEVIMPAVYLCMDVGMGVINPRFSHSFPGWLGFVGLLTFRQKHSRQFINIQIFSFFPDIVAWRIWVTFIRAYSKLSEHPVGYYTMLALNTYLNARPKQPQCE